MEVPLELLLFMLLIATALMVVRTRDLFAAAMLLGIFSLISAGMLLLMDAVDVSLTEAAVGSGFSTILILGALSLTDRYEKPSTQHRWTGKGVVLLMGGLLVYGSLDMPRYGDPAAPAQVYLAPDYISGSEHDIDVPNVVTSILSSYRGFDTFGEVTVVLTAAVGALLLLGGGSQRRRTAAGRAGGGDLTHPRRPPQRMRENLILRIVGMHFFPLILLFALHVQFHGDFGPGGGFQAGVIFASAWILYGLIFGLEELRRVLNPAVVEFCIALGVLIYGGVGVSSMIAGGSFLSYGVLDSHDPVHGQHLGIFWIEMGVGITVAAVMVMIFYAFAGRRAER